jgi:hypothetical protein
MGWPWWLAGMAWTAWIGAVALVLTLATLVLTEQPAAAARAA